MCKYCCENDKKLLLDDFDNLVEVKKNKIKIIFEGFVEYKISINYCPICGRRLNS